MTKNWEVESRVMLGVSIIADLNDTYSLHFEKHETWADGKWKLYKKNSNRSLDLTCEEANTLALMLRK